MKTRIENKRIRFTIAIFLISAAIWSGAYVVKYFCKIKIPSNMPAKSFAQSKESGPVINGFQYSEYDACSKRFEIRAERFFIKNKKMKPLGFRIALGKSAELKEVEAVFYRENMPVSRITSGNAILDIKTKDVVFEGRPAMITDDKRALRAKRILWNSLTGKIDARGDCVLAAEGKSRYAGAILCDVELNEFDFSGKISK